MKYFGERLAKSGLNGITLAASHNELDAESIKILLEQLASSPKLLGILDLSENPLGDDGASILAKELSKHPSITTLILSAAGITGKSAIESLDNLIANENDIMTSIDLSKNSGITDSDLLEIATLVSKLKRDALIEKLDVTGIPFSSATKEAASKITDKIKFDDAKTETTTPVANISEPSVASSSEVTVAGTANPQAVSD